MTDNLFDGCKLRMLTVVDDANASVVLNDPRHPILDICRHSRRFRLLSFSSSSLNWCSSGVYLKRV